MLRHGKFIKAFAHCLKHARRSRRLSKKRDAVASLMLRTVWAKSLLELGLLRTHA